MAEIVQAWVRKKRIEWCEHAEADETLRFLAEDPTLRRQYQFCPTCGKNFEREVEELVDCCSYCGQELIQEPRPKFCHSCGREFHEAVYLEGGQA